MFPLKVIMPGIRPQSGRPVRFDHMSAHRNSAVRESIDELRLAR